MRMYIVGTSAYVPRLVSSALFLCVSVHTCSINAPAAPLYCFTLRGRWYSSNIYTAIFYVESVTKLRNLAITYLHYDR